MTEISNSLFIVDDEPEILDTLKRRIKINIGSEPTTTMNPDRIFEYLKEGNPIKVLAFDYDLQYVSKKTGLQYLVELGKDYNSQVETKVLFSKGIIDREKVLFCKKMGITVFEKNLKELPGQLLLLMHNRTESQRQILKNTIGEIVDYKRSSDEIWNDMKYRFKNELLKSLNEIENKEARFNLNMTDSISISDLISEIENETPIGLEKIESWIKAHFIINSKK